MLAADEGGFGCRADKLNGCAAQRAAWDRNDEIMTPIFTAVREPLPKWRRRRGENGVAWTLQKNATILRRDQMQTDSGELTAMEALAQASVSRTAAATERALR